MMWTCAHMDQKPQNHHGCTLHTSGSRPLHVLVLAMLGIGRDHNLNSVPILGACFS